MSHVISRGTLIRTAALGLLAAATSGCRGLPGTSSAPAAARAKPAPLTITINGVPAAVPGLVPGYAGSQRAVRWVVPPVIGGRYVMAEQTGFQLWSGMTWKSDALTWSAEPLDTALHQRNFNQVVLQPGAASSFMWKGQTYALPVSQYPWAVQWRSDVFAAAGLPGPAPDWTLDDFTEVCTALQGHARSGKQPVIQAPLGPLSGQKFLWVPPGGFEASPYFGDWGLWSGFALGFGGTPASGGRFRLTDQGTVEGLARLIDLARNFAAPPPVWKQPQYTANDVPTIPTLPAGNCNGEQPYAMVFSPYVPPLGETPPALGCAPVWRWARLPRFPVDPVIPTAVVGVGLVDGTAFRTRRPMPVAQALPYIDAAVGFMLWLYGSEAQALLAAAGLPPVLADPAVQRRFWEEAAAPAQAVGDWQHFRPYTAGWPAVPPSRLIGDALAGALASPTQLPALLAQAEQQMNGWVQKAMNSATGAGAG